jgi:hypothetical protein
MATHKSTTQIVGRDEWLGYGRLMEEPEFNDPRLVLVYEAEFR